MTNRIVQVLMTLNHPHARIPQYSTEGAACFDLFSCDETIIISAKEAAAIRIGVSFDIPEGYVMKLYSRSGHGFNHGLRLVNGTGIIDSDYRGEVGVKLFNDSCIDYVVKRGDKIAQGEIVPVYEAMFVPTDVLSETKRGTGGYGSTGR